MGSADLTHRRHKEACGGLKPRLTSDARAKLACVRARVYVCVCEKKRKRGKEGWSVDHREQYTKGI